MAADAPAAGGSAEGGTRAAAASAAAPAAPRAQERGQSGASRAEPAGVSAAARGDELEALAGERKEHPGAAERDSEAATGQFWDNFQRAGLLRRWTFSWATPLMNVAFKREIEPGELWHLLHRHKSETLTKKLEAAWHRELEKRGREGARLWRALIPVFGYEYFQAFMYHMAWLVVIMTTNAVLLVQILNLLDDFAAGTADTVTAGSLEIPYFGFVDAVLFGIGEIFRSVFINQHWAIACVTGINVRAAAAALLFQKTTRLRNSGNAAGQLLNMMSNDVERLREACTYGIFIASTPITLLTIILVGLWVLGPSILAGFVILILSVPIQARIARVTSRLRRQSIKITDERVTLMNEILQAAQLIKLYAWESSFVEKVARVRAAELVKIRHTTYVKAVNAALSQVIPLVTSFASFLVHTAILGETLTASQAFATLSLFNVSRFPLSVLPLSVRFTAEAAVGLQRIGDYLKLEEIIPEQSTDHLDAASDRSVPAIEVQDAQFTWGSLRASEGSNEGNSSAKQKESRKGAEKEDEGGEEEESASPLRVESLAIRQASLTCIVGAVGSGKSSLFASLLGDMRRTQGRSCIRGSIAYVGQNPWVFNATFQENILFGKPYEAAKFRRAIRVAALEPDLKALPSGLSTELGERGINVSGGQKARLALARAVYADCDVYLLDDVLSAVDAHVSAHIWKECIRSALLDKTVVLVTHGLHLLKEADQVVVLQDMRIVAKGTYNELLNSEYGHMVLSTAFDAHKDSAEADQDSGNAESSAALDQGQERNEERGGDMLGDESTAMTSDENAEILYNREASTILEDEDEDVVSSSTEAVARIVSSELNLPDEDGTRLGKLTTQEDRQVGAVSKTTIRAFAKSAGGRCVLLFCFLLFWLSEGSKNASEAWLTAWTADTFLMEPWFYNTIYGVFMIVVTFFMVLRGVIFGRALLRASQGLHDAAFLACMRARMDFFQVTPLGRILARFSSDIDKIDTLLVDIAEVCISLLVRTFLAIIVVAAALPAFLVAVVPLVFLYVRLLNYFRRVVRQMKRIDSISRSPLISQVQSLVLGLTDTRAYGRLDAAINRQYVLVEESSRGYLGFYMANRWIGFRLDYITTSIVAASAMLCIIFASTISAGLAGLVLSSSLQTAGILQFATRQAAELEAQFTSVERVRFFIESTPTERDTIDDDDSDDDKNDDGLSNSPDDAVAVMRKARRHEEGPASVAVGRASAVDEAWPAQGEICFENYSTRYRDGLPFVLKNLTMTIPGGKSTALVGRSGSGKSTVSAVALFRIVEAVHGRITIDGVNIAKVSLQTLRGRALAIVPQSPTLFAGTIRSNLDPFDEHTDDEIWQALENVHLADFVASLGAADDREQSPGSVSFHIQTRKSGLSHVLSEGGSNLSAGQRQLLAFGRALLKNARIICVDEGTSSVDEAADLAIQNTLQHACKGRTLIIVAHRLASTAHCDQICVLEQGALLEAGRPADLLQDPASQYAALWKAAISASDSAKGGEEH
ncbi:ABC transporter ATP-binding protein/permease VMR1 [Hondaea fermentalgiana]|uniref:ABC transporter ATP-binding protein/permease VMR1 n=1 Tax=Hondaea fermentalgiana TaxID=2315210 RepID=A0A2R5GJY3_9STRA|nr:ABC transporter ATP-binding protein/permease VMR1 [Hondaea fermentalgiana]|eukprot:GBG28953.1 ABC transporter ATP-binding protein/permease VMR1 [Hondaea fermentalgiana]